MLFSKIILLQKFFCLDAQNSPLLETNGETSPLGVPINNKQILAINSKEDIARNSSDAQSSDQNKGETVHFFQSDLCPQKTAFFLIYHNINMIETNS